MARIGIMGSYGGLNLGDEAILTAMISSLRGRLPDAELVVFSRNPDHTRTLHSVDQVVDVRGASRDEVRPAVQQLDLLLLGGGGILYDGEARRYLREVHLAQQYEIPTMTYAVGAGPLDDHDERRMVHDALMAMPVITVRDADAQRVLEEIGLEAPVEVTADPALLLESEPFPVEWLEAKGIPTDRPLVGMSVREPGKAASNLDVAGYHALLAEAADFVVHRFGTEVVFVPMEAQDIRHSHAVISHMIGADHAHVLRRDYRPAQALGLMQHFDLVIAMRLHVLIFAALCGVPFLPLPYAGKVTEFVQAMGVSPPAPVTRESGGPLLAAVDQTWDDRDQLGSQLRSRVADLQERARRTVDLVLDGA
jgi:polysaccharide pyruvyl transferase CsaB